jgi:hypothetical protein
MNPWIEQDGLWPDFHVSLVPMLRRQLTRQVTPKYFVQLEEHVYIHELPPIHGRSIRPDLAVVRPPGGSAPGALVGVAEIEAPFHPWLPDEEVERVPFLEIRDRQSRDLVTVVELLSPSNKRRGEDRGKYLDKRRGVLKSAAHLVEIDLLRGHDPMPLEGQPDCTYSVLVSRAERRPIVDFWPIALRDRLPVVPIPLRPPDLDAQLDLQEALNQVYDDAGYAHFIYSRLPDPPLGAEDAQWARRFVPEAR